MIRRLTLTTLTLATLAVISAALLPPAAVAIPCACNIVCDAPYWVPCDGYCCTLRGDTTCGDWGAPYCADFASTASTDHEPSSDDAFLKSLEAQDDAAEDVEAEPTPALAD